jgi:phosphate-selective porin OprO/OprP
MSSHFSPTVKKELTQKQHDVSCKVMKIRNNITLRCGCFEKVNEANKHLAKFTQRYKNAYVTSTYKYRFKEQKEESVVTTKVATPMLIKKEKHIAIEVPQQKVLQVIPPTVVLEKEKKQKKVKKKRSKYVKKRESTWFYDRYLKVLKSKHPNQYGYKYKFGAQASYDIGYVYEADKNYFDSDFRRVRVYHKGSFFDEKLFYELEYSFTGPNYYKDNFVGYKDKLDFLELEYRIKAGNIKIPFSLERYTSSKNLTFMERAATDTFSDNRKLGAEVLLSKKLGDSRLNFFTALYSDSIDERSGDAYGQDGYALRLTYAYKFRKRHLFSLGYAHMIRNMKGEDVKLSQSSESRFLEDKYISIKVKDVDTMSKSNIEALYIFDKYALQAEYTLFELDAYNKRDYIQNYNFNAYYIEGSYFLRGKGKRYKLKESVLGKIKPNIDGALEFALRYSYLNLTDTSNDKDEIGGSQTDYTVGMNWYVSKEMKFMINYIVSKPTDTQEYDGLLQILQARILFSF